MYNTKVPYLIGVICVVFFTACNTQKVNQTSTDRLYKTDNNALASSFYIYHINDSVSQLFYSISNEILVYKKTDTSIYFFSNVTVLVKTSLEDNLNFTIDTATTRIRDRQAEVVGRQLKGSFYFRLRAGQKYHIDIQVDDVNKKIRYASSLYADKTNKDTRQNFLVTSILNEVLFNSYYKSKDNVNVRSERNTEKLFNVDYFKYDFKLALPPFASVPIARIDYRPDSTFSIYSNDDRQFQLALPEKGFYHLKTNDKTKDGITFFVYEPTYPKIKNSEQMILATRYIMAKKEFDNCMNAADKKAAIDKFWIDLGGSNERATELIRKYYGRVLEANKLFTDFREGWKTDRGMIYIVFGAPTRVTKRKNGEVWTYGDTGNPNSTVFSFIKIVNPFTDNDYELERNEIFKMPWYQAVDMWRQGRIYLDN